MYILKNYATKLKIKEAYISTLTEKFIFLCLDLKITRKIRSFFNTFSINTVN